ncbi:HDIG domain-containing protein [Candidatus Woesearchaeota archaeon]|nr:HDIG domain-containing protein [Candidatus Woesearchaeota archaeon]
MIHKKRRLDEGSIARLAYQMYNLKDSRTHPWSHTKRVAAYAKELGKKYCPDLLGALVVGAYFHDIGRKDDKGGTAHAIESASILKRLFLDGSICLETQSHQDTIVYGIEHHADTKTGNRFPVVDNYPEIEQRGLDKRVIACLWDADRLDLARFDYRLPLQKEFFSTEMAREFVNSDNHLAIYYSNGKISIKRSK